VTDSTVDPGGADARRGAFVACPFVYADGRACTGHVVRVEAYKADITWSADDEGRWRFGFQPRSHYHVFCSEKGTMRDSGGRTRVR
jgi:hypothetical protein